MPLCPQCGISLRDDAKFCNKCGTKVSTMGGIVPQPSSPNSWDCDTILTPSEIQQIGGGYKGKQVGAYITNQIKSFESPVKGDKIQQIIRLEDGIFRNTMHSLVGMYALKSQGSISKNFYLPLKKYFDWVMKYKSQLNLDARDIIEYLALAVNMQLVNNHFLPDAVVVTFSSKFGQILKQYQNNPEGIFSF